MATLKLVFAGPNDERREVALTGYDALLGRADESDVLIEHVTVSARHGIFKTNALGYTFTDLGSRNGSAVKKSGSRDVRALSPGHAVQLEPGDALLLGSSSNPLSITIEDGHAPYAPVRSLERTMVAAAPLAELLTAPIGAATALAARALDAKDPSQLAKAALEFVRTLQKDGGFAAAVLAGAGFEVSAGDAAPRDFAKAAREHRELVRLEGGPEGTIGLVAPLIAHNTWHGFLALWSGELDDFGSPIVDALNVAASLIALAVSALVVRAEAEAIVDRQRRVMPAPVIGSSRVFLEAIELAQKWALADLPILLSGETGTGKEIFARLIHEHSARKNAPFVVINCAALPATLLEAELFGYVAGAFTGANRDHRGVFEQADGGTLFLDKLGEMSPAMQAGILRAIENGEIRAIGDSAPRRIDVRVLSATHKSLAALIEAGTFRTDLAYRIQAAELCIPPLRDRGDDALLMAHVFLGLEAQRMKKRILGFTPEALLSLAEYPFPGNVRELKNELARAVALTPDGSFVVSSSFSARVSPKKNGKREHETRPRTLSAQVELAEKHAVETALARADGNMTKVARELGLSRQGLYRMLERLGLKKEVHG